MGEKTLKDEYEARRVPEVSDFFSHVTKSDGTPLTPQEQVAFLEGLNEALVTSPELAKIHFNTQVYNVIENEVTTRGGHSEGVALTAENLVKAFGERNGTSDSLENRAAFLLARAFGYMHDLGHTPFGHDGEGALDTEMSRFAVDKDYRDKRIQMFGINYTIGAEDYAAEDMCYEHNETSSIIGSKFMLDYAKSKGIILSPDAIQYVKTGILAHSTSRVKEEPVGLEQKAVRLADKIAYIPQDLLDLVKQGVLHVDDLTSDELALLGLDIGTFTDSEKGLIERGERSEEAIIASKKEDIETLRRIDKLPKSIRNAFFSEDLNDRVADVQATLARQCIGIDDKGQPKLTGKKDIVDQYDKAVNKKEYPEDRDFGTKEHIGEAIFSVMRAAQKNLSGESNLDRYTSFMQGDPNFQFEKIGDDSYIMDGKTYTLDELGVFFQNYEINLPKEERAVKLKELGGKIGVNRMAEFYKDFLREKEGLSPQLASLWVTKAKYQDSFINGELAKFSRRQDEPVREDGDGRKTLGDFNDKNVNAWKMKATFQYYYSHPDSIPKEFRDKYPIEQYTPQHLTAAFIASFTNEGLDTMYSALVAKGLVVSREAAIKAIQDARPDLDVEDFLETKMEWEVGVISSNNEKTIKKYKVPTNDVIEILYRDATKSSIVTGVDLEAMPYHKIEEDKILSDAAEKEVEGRELKTSEGIEKKAADALARAIKVSEEVTPAETVLEMTQRVVDRQNEKQIEPHRQKVAEAKGIVLENPTKSDDEGR